MTNEGFILLLLQVIIALLIAYLTNYINQKGKNWANKEDLQQLTQIVEAVKNNFQVENIRLKAELNILTERKNQIFTEEKEAIILFHTTVNDWLWVKCTIPIFDYNETNFNDLGEKIISLKNQYSQVQVLFSKVQLLVDNPQLIDIGYQFISETSKLHKFVETQSSKFKSNLTLGKVLIDSLIRKEFHSSDTPQEVRDFVIQRFEKNNKEKEEFLTIEYFNEQHQELFKVSIDLLIQLERIAKEHLKSRQLK